jgi:hypothetical protein
VVDKHDFPVLNVAEKREQYNSDSQKVLFCDDDDDDNNDDNNNARHNVVTIDDDDFELM